MKYKYYTILSPWENFKSRVYFISKEEFEKLKLIVCMFPCKTVEGITIYNEVPTNKYYLIQN
jgi:pyoverdine/dityrosine biosynthesis protein Dit1